MRRAAALLALALVAAPLAGCGSSSSRAERVTLADLNIRYPPATTGSPAPAPLCGTASLRPPAPMPTPGAMPVGSSMWQIQKRGYLNVGIAQDTEPLAFVSPVSGQPEGFEIDLARQIAAAIFGNKPGDVHFHALTSAQRDKAAQTADDLVIDAVTITCKRRKEEDFSNVYFDAKQQVLVPAGSQIHSVADLAGHHICVTGGSTSLYTLEHVARRAHPYLVSQRSDCLVALQEGLVDGITSDSAILFGLAKQDKYAKIISPILADEPYGIAIRKKYSDLVRFVNGVFDEMRRNGAWRHLYSIWFSSSSGPPRPRYSG
jgi:polar amino acid transport system substrate-binding protein